MLPCVNEAGRSFESELTLDGSAASAAKAVPGDHGFLDAIAGSWVSRCRPLFDVAARRQSNTSLGASMAGIHNGQSMGLGGQAGQDVNSATEAQAVRDLSHRRKPQHQEATSCFCQPLAASKLPTLPRNTTVSSDACAAAHCRLRRAASSSPARGLLSATALHTTFDCLATRA